VKVSHKFRFYPTPPQVRQLAKEFGCARHAYNWVLKLRTDSFKDGRPMNYNQADKEWTKHRNEPACTWLRECSSMAQQQAERHLQVAFVNFFEKRAEYPAFKTKRSKQAITYAGVGTHIQWCPKNLRLSLPKLGRLNVRWSRPIENPPSTVTITKDVAGRYFVTLCLEESERVALPKTGAQVGVDLGISRLATLSTGERIANPRWTMRHAKRLTFLQRRLSKKVLGSGHYRCQRLQVGKLQAHIADCRKDHLDKLTLDIVRRFDVIAIEDLNARGMMQNRSLAKHVACASFGMFRRMLEYKCRWYGKELRLADRFFPSSKRCSTCGHIHESMPLNLREFDCAACGTHHDRDHNAAINILAAGRAVSGPGGPVRPRAASSHPGKALRRVNQPALSGRSRLVNQEALASA
jgi:putative transposase